MVLPQLVVVAYNASLDKYIRFDTGEAAKGKHVGTPFIVKGGDLQERVFEYEKGCNFLNNYLESAEVKVKDDREVGVIFGEPIMTPRTTKLFYPAHFFEFDLDG